MKWPRYEVHSITGYSTGNSVPGEGKLSTTWWVADSWNCYREVPLQVIAAGAGSRARRDGTRNRTYIYSGTTTTTRRSVVERNCERLNREHDEWLAAVE